MPRGGKRAGAGRKPNHVKYLGKGAAKRIFERLNLNLEDEAARLYGQLQPREQAQLLGKLIEYEGRRGVKPGQEGLAAMTGTNVTVNFTDEEPSLKLQAIVSTDESSQPKTIEPSKQPDPKYGYCSVHRGVYLAELGCQSCEVESRRVN